MSYFKQREWSDFQAYRPTLDADHARYKEEYEHYCLKIRDHLRIGEWPGSDIRHGYDKAKELLCRYLDSRGITMSFRNLNKMHKLKLKELQAR